MALYSKCIENRAVTIITYKYIITDYFCIMTGRELRDKVNQSKGVVLYFKNDRCAPCLAIRTKVEDLITTKFPKIEFIIADSQIDPLLSNEFNVFANPTILTFFEGKEYSRKSKYISIDGLSKETKRLYKMVF